jgi:hypothetical protein
MTAFHESATRVDVDFGACRAAPLRQLLTVIQQDRDFPTHLLPSFSSPFVRYNRRTMRALHQSLFWVRYCWLRRDWDSVSLIALRCARATI